MLFNDINVHFSPAKIAKFTLYVYSMQNILLNYII